MNRKVFFLFTCLLFAGFIGKSQQPEPRQILLFDDGWKFHFGHAGDPSRDFNYGIANIYSKSGNAQNSAIDPAFRDDSWQSVQLPHDWAVALPFVYSPDFNVQSHGYKPVGGLFPETSIGWYRKHFMVSRKDSGQRFSLRFDGVFRDAKFWINGFYLGNNESGYIGVTYDLTDYIRFDQDNVIVVRVDATQYEGWFYEGAGIYRHVWFITTRNLHVAGDELFIYTDIKGSTALVTVETTLANENFFPAECQVSVMIKDQGGKEVAQSPASTILLKERGTGTVIQQLTVENPRLWSTDDPYLYRAVVTVTSGSLVADNNITRFGIRSISLDPREGLFLNGKNMKLLGACCHQDHAGVGTALPDFIQYYRVGLLKEMGVNGYRTCHHPPAPELLDACDSLGLLVLDETRLLNSSPEYMGQFERMIKRDRNHPSVFLWSVGNEENVIQANGIGKRLAQSLLSRQRQLDPTRTSTYAADLPNVLAGINEVIPVRGFNYRQYAVEEYHKSHPGQPIIGTEMGSTVTTRGIYEKDTVRCYVPDQDITAPWWASRAEVWWPLCAEQPAWMGGFVWTGLDYRGEPTPYQWPNVNSHFGVMDVCGFPKNIYYYYQSWWSDQDVLHISPHWNWKGKEGLPIKVWVNSNADTLELFLNGNSYGKKVMLRNSHLEWEVPFAPGTIRAVGIRHGKKITASVVTTGDPVKVLLSSGHTVLKADGQDVSVVNITVADTAGHEVPDAGQMITFTLKGNARIIGVGNGDPSSHEPDQCSDDGWQRRLFNGKCQVIVRAGKIPGPVVLEAKADQLEPAAITLQVGMQ